MTDNTNNNNTTEQPQEQNITNRLGEYGNTFAQHAYKMDKFLHFFELKTEHQAKSFLGMDLEWGVRIICIVSLLLDLISVVGTGAGFAIVFEAVQLFSVAVNLYATYSKSINQAFLGYYIQMVIFYLQLGMTLIGLYAVVTLFSSIKAVVIFFAILIIMFAFKIALLWYLYSYVLKLQTDNQNNTPAENIAS